MLSEDYWPDNYFNYFTEVEEHFRKVRGTALFMLSPVDIALVETWKNGGVPLEAVLRGIDITFEKWRARKIRTQKVNMLAFCAQAVLTEAQALAGVERPKPAVEREAPFPIEDVTAFLTRNIAQLEASRNYPEIVEGLRRLLAEVPTLYHDLEQLEQRLTALEEKMAALARSRQSEDDLFKVRRELDRQLRPYRGKMSAEQISMLERQYTERALLESCGLPRLSLFYLRPV